MSGEGYEGQQERILQVHQQRKEYRENVRLLLNGAGDLVTNDTEKVKVLCLSLCW